MKNVQFGMKTFTCVVFGAAATTTARTASHVNRRVQL